MPLLVLWPISEEVAAAHEAMASAFPKALAVGVLFWAGFILALGAIAILIARLHRKRSAHARVIHLDPCRGFAFDPESNLGKVIMRMESVGVLRDATYSSGRYSCTACGGVTLNLTIDDGGPDGIPWVDFCHACGCVQSVNRVHPLLWMSDIEDKMMKGKNFLDFLAQLEDPEHRETDVQRDKLLARKQRALRDRNAVLARRIEEMGDKRGIEPIQMLCEALEMKQAKFREEIRAIQDVRDTLVFPPRPHPDKSPRGPYRSNF